MAIHDQMMLYWKRHCAGGIAPTPFLMELKESVFDEWVGNVNRQEWADFVKEELRNANSDWDMGKVIAGAWIYPTDDLIAMIEAKLDQMGTDRNKDIRQLRYRAKRLTRTSHQDGPPTPRKGHSERSEVQ